MSTLYVNKIQEETSNNGVHIPGHIIQTVTSTSSTVITVSSATATTFGLSQVFTPHYATSKILITASIAGEHYSFSDLGLRMALQRDGSDIRNWQYLDYHSSDSSQNISTQTLQFVEDAQNTNARTYQWTARPSNASGTARINNYGAPSHMTIMEIAQ
jgi:hypothetical protein